MNQIGYKLEKADVCPLFLCPDRLKTGKNSSRPVSYTHLTLPTIA